MQVVADLHLHSKYSRAVSPRMILPVMAEYAKKKGIDLLTASDWTHPLWFREIRNQLEEAGEGIYKIKNGKDVFFLLSTEISSIYKQGEKLRRIHNLVFVPSFETAEKVSQELIKRGCNLMADGRPIIGLSSRDLLELILSIDKRCFLIPCHVWTPHFGIYGSASGFDSLEEAFGDLSKYIYGIETGLSSDPEMNWQVEELLTRTILSFSDAHSAAKMGREATVFEISAQSPELSYEVIRHAIMGKTSSDTPGLKSRILYTIEFYPEEGKYHFSGHRNCNVVFGPEDIRIKGNVCPVCGRGLTEGVLFRVQQLANEKLLDRVAVKHNQIGLKWYTDKKKVHPPYIKLVPLNEIIAEAIHAPVTSPKVQIIFDNLCEILDSEINVLLKANSDMIAKIAGEQVAKAVEKVRTGDITLDPGYDGVYGKAKIELGEKETEIQEGKDAQAKSDKNEKKEQLGLF